MDELDILLKNVLNDEVNPTEQDIDENFLKLKTNLLNKDTKKYYFKRLSYMNFKKVAVIAMCCIFCTTTILISSSTTVRAAALDALDSIKTIFVMEGSGNDLKVVQKPTSEAAFVPSVSCTTLKSDAEVGELVGYKILFPKTLAYRFVLENRSLGVRLNKLIPYDSMPQIQQQMSEAIYNQEEFTNLSTYSPIRTAAGFYKKGDTTVFIYSATLLPTTNNYPESDEVLIGDIKGAWNKFKIPDYPILSENGIGKADMSVKPVIKDYYSLEWVNNDIHYMLSTIGESTLSKEEAIAIATEFQAAQP